MSTTDEKGIKEAVKRFMPQFEAVGVMPVMGAGSSSTAAQPEPIEPGSSVGIVLVRGDMDISATCTVTYMDANRLLACGHPLMQSGRVDMPMTKSTVLASLPSPLLSDRLRKSPSRHKKARDQLYRIVHAASIECASKKAPAL